MTGIFAALEDISEDLNGVQLPEVDLTNFDEETADEQRELLSEDVAIAVEGLKSDLQVSVIALLAYQDHLNNRLSKEQLTSVVFAAETAAYRDSDSYRIVVATELAVVDRLIGAIGGLFNRIKIGLQKYIDYCHYNVTYLSFQRGKIRELLNKLNRATFKTTEIKIGINKYMQFGKYQETVQDMKTYFAQFHQVVGTMTPFNEALSNLSEEDLGSSFKILGSSLLGDPEEWFKKRFNSVEDNLKDAVRGVSGNVVKKTPAFIQYGSPIMLGLSSVNIRLPSPELYRSGEYEDLYGAHRFFYANVDRMMKIKISTLVSGSERYTVDRQDLIKALTDADKLIDSSLRLISISNKLSMYFATLTLFSLPDKRKQQESPQIVFFESVQFLTRISAIIFDSVPSAFNFTLGNIKQLNRIAERAVK